MRLCAAHIPGAELPQIHKINAVAFPRGNVLHLLGNILLAGALHVNVLHVAGRVVATNSFPKLVGAVSARAVDQEGVKEDGVPLLHVEVNPGVVLGAPDPVVHLVHPLLPVGVVVLL
jgi:hypothetical protein